MFADTMANNQRLAAEKEQRKVEALERKKAAEEKKKKKKKKHEPDTEKTACGSGQRVFHSVCTQKTYIDNCMC